MNNKEFAYKLYNLSIGESIDTPLPAMVSGKSQEVVRVPGGWVWGSVFVKYNDEFREFANSPTEKTFHVECGICKNQIDFYKKESYQKRPYICPGCGCEISGESE